MGLFSSKEEKLLDEKLAEVIITPETKEQYEQRVGYKVVVVAPSRTNLGVHISGEDGTFWATLSFKKILVDGGIEAVVNTGYHHGSAYGRAMYYGLPVAKAK